MTICFPTAACSALDFCTAAGVASRLGFHGVELHAFDNLSIATATNALLTCPEKIGRIFSDANVAVDSLNAGPAVNDLPRRIALAAELHCPLVRFQCDELFSHNPAVSKRAVEQLRDDADQAAAANIMLLIESRPITGSALAMWHLLDRIDHPAVACCWNTLSAFIAGDSPAVAVPTLNSRIHCVLLKDAKTDQPSVPFSDGPESRVFSRKASISSALRAVAIRVELGTGDVPLRNTLDRLRGIGFRNGLIISPPASPSIQELEQSLKQSLGALRRWNALPTPIAPA